MLSVLKRPDGTEKDTLRNVRSVGELVINSVTEQMVYAANACADHLPPHESEFDFAGLTPTFCSCRTAHVAESPVRFECTLQSETALGHGRGAASIVLVSVKRAYVASTIYSGKGQLDIEALRLIGRSGVEQYLVADGQFTIARKWTGEPYEPD